MGRKEETPMTGATTLFATDFLHQLDRLHLASRKLAVGRTSGERRSARRGQSVEFADYKTYSPGDDYRRVDWNAYARLERLFLKLYVEEQETSLHLLIDASASMEWGEPTKFRLACQLAGALGYLALAGYDRASAGLVRAGLVSHIGPLWGRRSVWRLWSFLEGAEPRGEADLAAGLRALGRFRPAPGIAVVISDCLGPLSFLDGLTYLQAARQEVVLVQVLAPDELAPVLEGDLRLIDHETEAAQEVSAGPALLAAYQQRLAAHTGAIAAFCRDRAIPYLQVPSTLPVADLVLQSLRQAGVVR
jgi:uncharacterized protein (DUF58 family)